MTLCANKKKRNSCANVKFLWVYSLLVVFPLHFFFFLICNTDVFATLIRLPDAEQSFTENEQEDD